MLLYKGINIRTDQGKLIICVHHFKIEKYIAVRGNLMNYMKWHKYSSIMMLIGALICVYSGHKMVRQKNGKID